MRSALCPILVRRDDQLAILEDALLAAQRGEGRFVVLAGEAGIGKTRLANELVGEARRLGCAVLTEPGPPWIRHLWLPAVRGHRGRPRST